MHRSNGRSKWRATVPTESLKKSIGDKRSLESSLPLKRIEDRATRILSPDHKLSQSHRTNAGKRCQEMRVEIRQRLLGWLPDENPDEAVEGEVDYKTWIWQIKQGGLRIMYSSWLLINLIFRSLVDQVYIYFWFAFSSEPPWYVVPDSFNLSRNVPNILSYGVPLSP